MGNARVAGCPSGLETTTTWPDTCIVTTYNRSRFSGCIYSGIWTILPTVGLEMHGPRPLSHCRRTCSRWTSVRLLLRRLGGSWRIVRSFATRCEVYRPPYALRVRPERLTSIRAHMHRSCMIALHGCPAGALEHLHCLVGITETPYAVFLSFHLRRRCLDCSVAIGRDRGVWKMGRNGRAAQHHRSVGEPFKETKEQIDRICACRPAKLQAAPRPTSKINSMQTLCWHEF